MKFPLITGLLCFVAIGDPSVSSARETTAPDILLIIADDLGAQLGCYGDAYVKTPHMDALASSGLRLDNAWVTQAGCSPSRGSIMTGLYPHRNGLIGLAHTGFEMNRSYPTIPSLLKDAGYYTGVVGKVNIAPRVPFDFAIEQGNRKLEAKNPLSYAAHVIEFLRKAGDRPIFLNVSFIDPHRPFANQVKGMPETPATAADVKPLPFLGDIESQAVREDTAGYYNGVQRVDIGVGMILDALRKAGRLDNTLIILVGDHGAPFTRSKTSGYHAGLHIPFLLKWPGVTSAGTSSKALVSTVDILPTFLDAAGVTTPAVEGVSLRSVAADPASSPREVLFAEHGAHLPVDYYPRRMVRNHCYQLIHNLLHQYTNPEKGSDMCSAWDAVMNKKLGTSQTLELMQRFANPPEYELYDLQNDPNSLRNLIDDPSLADIAANLKEKLINWQETTADPLADPAAAKPYYQEILKVNHTRALKAPNYRERMEQDENEAKLNQFR